MPCFSRAENVPSAGWRKKRTRSLPPQWESDELSAVNLLSAGQLLGAVHLLSAVNLLGAIHLLSAGPLSAGRSLPPRRESDELAFLVKDNRCPLSQLYSSARSAPVPLVRSTCSHK